MCRCVSNGAADNTKVLLGNKGIAPVRLHRTIQHTSFISNMSVDANLLWPRSPLVRGPNGVRPTREEILQVTNKTYVPKRYQPPRHPSCVRYEYTQHREVTSQEDDPPPSPVDDTYNDMYDSELTDDDVSEYDDELSSETDSESPAHDDPYFDDDYQY